MGDTLDAPLGVINHSVFTAVHSKVPVSIFLLLLKSVVVVGDVVVVGLSHVVADHDVRLGVIGVDVVVIATCCDTNLE